MLRDGAFYKLIGPSVKYVYLHIEEPASVW